MYDPLLSVDSILANGSRETVHGLPMTTKVEGVEINGDFLFLAVKNSPVAPNGDFLDGMAENCSLRAQKDHKYLGFAWRRVKSVLTAEFTALMSMIAQGPDPDSLFMAVCLVNSQKEACVAAGDTDFVTLFPRALNALEEEALASWAICSGLATSGPKIATALMVANIGAVNAQALAASRKASSASALTAAQAADTAATSADTAAASAVVSAKASKEATTSDLLSAQAILASAQSAQAAVPAEAPQAEKDAAAAVVATAEAALTAAQAADTAAATTLTDALTAEASAKASKASAAATLATTQTVDALRAEIVSLLA